MHPQNRSLIPHLQAGLAAALAVFPLLGNSATAQPQAQAQNEEETKLEPAPRWVDDAKAPWAPPAKLDATVPFESAPAPTTQQAPKSPELPPELAGFRPPSFRQRVLFDEPGDGALWARGGQSYKARFDAEGVTYYPRFGPNTPRHFPVSLRLDEVLVGGQPIAFERDVPYQRDESIVSYDRGSLIEYYELRADSLEQLFHFDSRPDAGDLVVRVAIDTELEVSATAAGFEFSNEHGRVGYSSAVVVDRDGVRDSVPTTVTDGRIEIRLPAELLERAEFPITVDPVITTFDISLDPDVDAYYPDVAYDETTNRYIVVWEEVWTLTDRDVWSVLWTSGGAMVAGSEVAIDFTTDCWQTPKVANNQIADQFLVVARTSPDCIASAIIEGRTRQAADNSMGSQFQISGGFSGAKVKPDVGGDPVTAGPTYYCVVWQREYAIGDYDVHYQVVRPDGTLLHPTTQLIDNSSGTLDHAPSISKSDGQRPFSSQEWNVVWQRQYSSGDQDIRGAQIHWDGSITTPSFSVDFSSQNDIFPQASSLLDGGSGPREWAVVYSRGSTSPRNLQATAFRGDTALTPSTNLTLLESAGGDEDHTFPAIDSDGNCFAIAYSESYNGGPDDYDVYVSTFDLAVGAQEFVCTESHTNLAFSSDGEFHPQIASTHSSTDGAGSQPRRFMAAWWDHDFPGTSDGDIEAGIYDSICPPGTPYCFGDGSGLACPCNNPGQAGQGCRNSTGAGATLGGFGTNYVASGDLVLRATNAIPGQPGLFFQGLTALNLGNGTWFGDGLRCCGTSVIRLQVAVPNGAGVAQSSLNLAAAGNVAAGDKRCYQFWYRNPSGSPCGALFNLTNGYEVTWTD